MLTRNEDTITYTADLNGQDVDLEIAFTMGVDWDHSDRMVSVVESWRVHKINGKANMLGDFWAEQLNDERVCDAIMEASAS